MYFLSSMEAIHTTSVEGKYWEFSGNRGVHSMLSTMVTGRLVVRRKVILHNLYLSVFFSPACFSFNTFMTNIYKE